MKKGILTQQTAWNVTPDMKRKRIKNYYSKEILHLMIKRKTEIKKQLDTSTIKKRGLKDEKTQKIRV